MYQRLHETPVLGAARFLFALAAAAAFLAWPGLAQGGVGCVKFCDDPPSGGGYGGGYDGGYDDGGSYYYDPGPTQEELNHRQANVLNDQAIAAETRGDFHEAIRIYREALAPDPNNAVICKNLSYPYNELGNDAYESGGYETAVSYYRESSSSPNDEVIRKNLENAEDESRWKKQAAEQKRQMKAAKGRIGNMLNDFAGEIGSSDPDDGDLGILGLDETDLRDSLAAKKPPPAGKGSMPDNSKALAKAGERVGLQLMEIEEDILGALPGKSAWDGGTGGTLDSPGAVGVAKSSRPRTPVQGGGPRYKAAAASSAAALTPGMQLGVPEIGPADPVPGQEIAGQEIDVEKATKMLGIWA